MSIWELRQTIEQALPWWSIPLTILLAAMVFGWVEFTSYRRKLRK